MNKPKVTYKGKRRSTTATPAMAVPYGSIPTFVSEPIAEVLEQVLPLFIKEDIDAPRVKPSELARKPWLLAYHVDLVAGT